MLVASIFRLIGLARGVLLIGACWFVGVLTAVEADNLFLVYEDYYISINIALVAAIISVLAYLISVCLDVMSFFTRRLYAKSSFSIIKKQSVGMISVIGGQRVGEVELSSNSSDSIGIVHGKIALKLVMLWRCAYEDKSDYIAAAVEIASMSSAHKRAVIAAILDNDAVVEMKQSALLAIESLGERSFARAFDGNVDLILKYILVKSLNHNGEIIISEAPIMCFGKSTRDEPKILFLIHIIHVLSLLEGGAVDSNAFGDIASISSGCVTRGVMVVEFLRSLGKKMANKSVINRVMGNADFVILQGALIAIMEVIYSSMNPIACKMIYDEISMNKSSNILHNRCHSIICAMLAFGAQMYEEAAHVANTIKCDSAGWISDVAGLLCLLSQLKLVSRSCGDERKIAASSQSSVLIETAGLCMSSLFSVAGRGPYYAKIRDAIKCSVHAAIKANHKESFTILKSIMETKISGAGA